MFDSAKESKCLIIAEVAQAHDGSVGIAHSYIDAIASAGADAVKFQTHIAEAESSLDEPWRIKFSYQDATRYDYWKRMEFTEDQWHGLKQHATDRRLQFLSSPFSIEAVELLERVGVSAWKIASGEVSNYLLLERMCQSQLPFLISTGMSSLDELDEAVIRLKNYELPVTVLQCTTAYPCPPEKVGLNMLGFFRERYACHVGLSDHSGTIYAGLAAAAVGIDVLEIHVTFSREMFGPDVPASITIEELRQLVEGIRFIERMKKNPVDKNAIAEELTGVRSLFTRSIVVRQNLTAGTTLKLEHLTAKKPGTGIPVTRMNEVVGKRLRRDVTANTRLTEVDLVEEV
jgi:N-acetylneuraminate synthase